MLRILILVCVGITYAGKDDFDSPTLGENWTWDDPDGDDSYSLTEEPGWFRFNVGGSEDMWSTDRGEAPLLLRPATEGDYSIETHVKIENQENSTYGALMVFKGPGKWIHLELIRNDGDGRDGVGVEYWPAVAGTNRGKNVKLDPDEVYLKIVKTGDDWEFLYKEKEGEDWKTLDTVNLHFDSPVQVGLVAKTWGGPEGPVVADFDYFRCPELGEVKAVEPVSSLAFTWAKIKVTRCY